MKKLFILNVIIGLAVLFAVTVMAEVPATDIGPSVSFRSVVGDKYVCFGSGSLLYNKPVIQSDLFISFNDGLYVDLWDSKSLNSSWENYGNEIDYGLGWSGKIYGFGLDVGVFYYDEPSGLTFDEKDSWNSHIKISRDLRVCTVYGSLDNYMVMPDSEVEGGNLCTLGAQKALEVNKLLSAKTYASVAYDDGAYCGDNGLIFHTGGELDWRITKKLTLIVPEVKVYVPLTVQDARENEIVLYSGFSYQF